MKETEDITNTLQSKDSHGYDITKLNSVAFSPRANHTDRAAAAGRRS